MNIEIYSGGISSYHGCYFVDKLASRILNIFRKKIILTRETYWVLISVLFSEWKICLNLGNEIYLWRSCVMDLGEDLTQKSWSPGWVWSSKANIHRVYVIVNLVEGRHYWENSWLLVCLLFFYPGTPTPQLSLLDFSFVISQNQIRLTFVFESRCGRNDCVAICPLKQVGIWYQDTQGQNSYGLWLAHDALVKYVLTLCKSLLRDWGVSDFPLSFVTSSIYCTMQYILQDCLWVVGRDHLTWVEKVF